jgi:hypothetical protein
MKRNLTPMLMMVVGVLLILGALAWYLVMATAPFGVQSNEAEGVPIAEVPRVSVSEAKAAFDAGSAVFIDVRGDTYYTYQHIPGAISIPLAEISERMNQLNPSDWVITY